MIRDELHLAGILKARLAPNFREVFDNVNLASNAFYPYWEKWYGEPVFSAQPQIDLLLVDINLQLFGVELKYFRKTSRGQINLPFYAGIGEALALLRFGFKTVSLWHFFDTPLDREDYKRLFSNCFSLIYYLDLPINYVGSRVFEDARQLEFRSLSPNGMVETETLPSLYGRANPYDSQPNAQRVQDMLRSVLRIPFPR